AKGIVIFHPRTLGKSPDQVKAEFPLTEPAGELHAHLARLLSRGLDEGQNVARRLTIGIAMDNDGHGFT
ncbi:MAG: hypothetical protein O3A85_09745, partial [Proteobacteria bacterium]|nr:hypothetical protein [Pseudomonadota bacterium]